MAEEQPCGKAVLFVLRKDQAKQWRLWVLHSQERKNTCRCRVCSGILNLHRVRVAQHQKNRFIQCLTIQGAFIKWRTLLRLHFL